MSLRILIFGRGWLGGLFARRWPDAILVGTDIADPGAVARALEEHAPTHVLNAAGRTGRPNVDALEDDPAGTLRSNLVGPVVLASACREREVHFTHLGSGCVYSDDGGTRRFREEDPPNFGGSLYARSKAMSEAALREFGALQLRIRLPISEIPSPRNLIDKLLRYPKIVSVPNSVTIVEDLYAPARALMETRASGVWNLVNPGVERHDELLSRYRETVDASHAFEVIDMATLATHLRAGRSNCLLDTSKLEAEGLGMPDFESRLPALMHAYGEAARAHRTVAPGRRGE